MELLLIENVRRSISLSRPPTRTGISTDRRAGPERLFPLRSLMFLLTAESFELRLLITCSRLVSRPESIPSATEKRFRCSSVVTVVRGRIC